MFFRVLQCLQDAAKAIPTKTRRPLPCRFDVACTIDKSWRIILKRFLGRRATSRDWRLSNSGWIQSSNPDKVTETCTQWNILFKRLQSSLDIFRQFSSPIIYPYLIHPAQRVGPKSLGDLKVFCLWSACLDTRQVVGVTSIWDVPVHIPGTVTCK